ncbi:MAG: MATE family efflux transporter [Ruthenibacterium sp.]
MLFSNRDLKRLVLPLICEQLLAVTVGMADTVMVSHVGEAAVSGVALVDALAILVVQVFAALCTGGTVVVSQWLGRKDKEAANIAAAQLLQITTLIALLLMLLTLVFRRFLLSHIFGVLEADVMAACNTYFWITALSLPFLAIYNAGAALLRSVGATSPSLAISFIMNLINIVGNGILIYAFDFGVAGAAFSTLISRAVAAMLILVLLFRANSPFFLRGKIPSAFKPEVLRSILSIGVPSGLENGMFQIGKLLIQRLLVSFGTIAIAANAVAGNIACIATLPGSAFSLALLTVVGRCMGANLPEEAARNTKKLLSASYLSMFACNAAVFFLLQPIASVFALSAQTTALVMVLMRWHCLFAALLWTPAFCLPSALRGAGDVKYTMKISIFSMWIFRILGSYFFSIVLGLGVVGVWFAIFSDWLFRSVLFFLRFIKGKWKNIQVLQ